MSELTLKSIEQLLDLKLDQKFDEKLEPIKTTLDAHSEILASHTQSLDAIAKNTSNWQTEMTVMREKIERHENVIKLLDEKLQVDVKTLLH